MADIDHIPLEFDEVPILTSYDAGLLWNPPEGAGNEDWHTMMRTHLDLAEEHYEAQFNAVVDLHLRAQRQAVLLAAFCHNLIRVAMQHGFENDTVKHVDGGVQVTDPMLIDFDKFIHEYQKIEGAFPIAVTEGFAQWNAADEAKKVEQPNGPENVPDPS